MTLGAAGNPHYLVGDAWVSTGLTFTTGTGVVIKATGYFKITVNGIVVWDETEFTSNMSPQAPGDWWGIDIQHWDDLSKIDATFVQYATYGLKLARGELT